MQKVLIADDEMAIALLINKLIHWDELDMQNIGVALNGDEAYRLAAENQPEIIVTDIRMPGMTGLELIERVHRESPETSFVLISGYSEFEYARQALRFGVEDYLLKPIKEQELNAALRRIAQKQEKNEALSREKNLVEWEHCQSRKRWLKRHLESESSDFDFPLHEQDLFHFSSSQFLFFLLTVDIDTKDPAVSAEILQKTEALFSEKMKHFFSDTESVILPKNRIGVWANLPEDGCTSERKWLITQAGKEFLRQLQAKNYNSWCTMLMTPPLPLEELNRETVSVLEDLSLLRSALFPDGFFDLQEVPKHYAKEKLSLQDEKKTELIHILDTGSEEALLAWGDSFSNGSFLSDFDLLWKLFSSQLSLAEACCSAVCFLGVPAEQAECVVSDWRRGLSRCVSESAVTDLRHRKSKELLVVLNACREKVEAQPIAMAKRFIRSNYSCPIGIEEIADAVHLNPTYFSALFKKSTGTNYVTFLTNVRIEEAKRLLTETDKTIAEIAEQIGYGDARYFSKVFIKTVGIRPAEYRKIHR